MGGENAPFALAEIDLLYEEGREASSLDQFHA